MAVVPSCVRSLSTWLFWRPVAKCTASTITGLMNLPPHKNNVASSSRTTSSSTVNSLFGNLLIQKTNPSNVIAFLLILLISTFFSAPLPASLLPFYLSWSPHSQFTQKILSCLFLLPMYIRPMYVSLRVLIVGYVLWDCELYTGFLCFMSKSHLRVSTYDNCLSGSGLPHSIWCFLDPSICLQISRCHFFSAV